MFSRAVVSWMLITFVVILLSDESLGSCDAQALQKCIPSQENNVPMVITSESLQKFCKVSEDTVSCLGNATGCLDDPHLRALYQGLRNLVDTVCRTLKAEYMTHAKCYQSSEMNATGNQCAQLEKGRTDTQRTPCELKNRLISCLVRSVDACCGPDAARLFTRLMEALFTPLSDSTGCRLRTDLEMDVPVVCVSERKSGYSNGMPSHHQQNNNSLYLAFIGVGLSLYIRLLFQT